MPAHPVVCSNPVFRLASLCAALAAAMFCSSLVLADDAAIELAPLVITGASHHSPLTVVTDPKQPRQPMPAADGADYLKTIPGFNAIRNGGANGDPVFRGMFGSRLNILSDGGVLLGACPGRMDAPTSYLAPESYDRLTVIKGPQTVLWGPGASAATILFERDAPRFGELGARLDGSLLAGSDGRFDRRIDASAGASQGYLRMQANRAQADDYDDGNGDTLPSRWQKWNSDVQLGWTPDADSLLELSAGRGDGEARYAGRSMDGSQFLRESLGLRFEQEHIGELFRGLQAQVYYNYADHVMDNFSLRTPSGQGMLGRPMASNVDRRTLGGRLVGTWEWAELELQAGVDAQRNEHRKRSSRFMLNGYSDYRQFPSVTDAIFHQYGGFAELAWRGEAGERVIGGLRLDLVEVSDERRTLSNPNLLSWANPTAGDSRRKNLPSGFLRYEQDLHGLPATAYVGLGHSERFPDYWELFSASVGAAPGAVEQAFDTVQPEKTTQLDLGLQYQDRKLQAWISAYAGIVDDYILFNYRRMPSGHSFSSVANVDATVLGGELGASYRLSEQWKTDASLAYAWGKNRSDDRALAQTPPLEARLGLNYQRRDWSAGALWRLVAAQNRVALNQGNVVGKDFGSSAGFAVFAVNAAYRLSRELKLSAGVDNLFDKQYSEHLNLAGNAGFGFAAEDSLSEPGRTLWTRLDFGF